MGKSEWIPASVKPEQTAKGTFCLIERNGKLYPETCYYFNKHQQDFFPDGNEDWADFENDEYYLPEGWYTLCDQCEKYWKVDVSFYMIGLDYPVLNSHSPTISDVNDPANDDSMLIEFQHLEHDTLQEGDYTEDLSRENFEYIIALEGDSCVLEWEEGLGLGLYGRVLVTDDYPQLELKTQLTPEKFLRRAENTFKTK